MFRKLVALLFIFAFLYFADTSYAVTVTINNPQGSISSSEFNVNVTVTGADDGKNYLRIDLYKDSTDKYFGETYNGSEWKTGTSDGKSYFPIDILNGSWTGDVKARVGSPSISEYDGQGSYKMRVRRYTSSGNVGGEDPNSNAVVISITAPTPTPTPTNTPTPTPNPTATPTPTPTKTPTPTPTHTSPSPTTRDAKAPSPSPQMMTAMNTNESMQGPPEQDVKGADISLGGNLDELEAKTEGYNWWRLLIVMGVVIVTGTCGVFLYNNHIKERSEELNSLS